MTRLRKILLMAVGALLLLVAAAFVSHLINRSGKPQFEGRTAAEWIELGAKRTSRSSGYQPDELTLTELEVAFLTMGPPAQAEIAQQILNFERTTGFRTNLFQLAENLPEQLRFSFMRDPASRASLALHVLRAVRPDWDTVAPLVKNHIASGAGDDYLQALNILGTVGHGATNSIPPLVQALTNNVGWSAYYALQSLFEMNTNALPALPAIIRDLEERRWNGWHLMILRRLGSSAGAAVPALETLLAALTSSGGDDQIAATILAIDPDNDDAFARLKSRFEKAAKTSKNQWRDLGLLDSISGPDPRVANLIEQYAGDTKWEFPSFRLFLEHDPEKALSVMHSYRGDAVDESGVLQLLLQRDPNDSEALGYLRGKITEPGFGGDRQGGFWIFPLRYCLSDSPGVVEMLDLAEQSTPPDAVMEAIITTRRHIELNGLLRKLRAAR